MSATSHRTGCPYMQPVDGEKFPCKQDKRVLKYNSPSEMPGVLNVHSEPGRAPRTGDEMMLSAGCRYGIRTVLYLTQVKEDDFVPVHVISDELDIPKYFLAKVVQQLVQHDVLLSHRGRGGGVALARSPGEIALVDIVRALDEHEPLYHCLIGLPDCEPGGTCPLHEDWACVQDMVRDVYENTTIDAIAMRLRTAGVTLSRGRSAGEAA
ncbi:MAG: Rrf2 family transcriptional regulator [Rhodothermales bacterium]